MAFISRQERVTRLECRRECEVQAASSKEAGREGRRERKGCWQAVRRRKGGRSDGFGAGASESRRASEGGRRKEHARTVQADSEWLATRVRDVKVMHAGCLRALLLLLLLPPLLLSSCCCCHSRSRCAGGQRLAS